MKTGGNLISPKTEEKERWDRSVWGNTTIKKNFSSRSWGGGDETYKGDNDNGSATLSLRSGSSQAGPASKLAGEGKRGKTEKKRNDENKRKEQIVNKAR